MILVMALSVNSGRASNEHDPPNQNYAQSRVLLIPHRGRVETTRVADEQHVGQWMHDFQAAAAKARETNRPLLLHFHAQWCLPCRQMEAVLQRPEVLQQLGRGVIGVKIDSQQNPGIVQRFGIETLPTDLFLDPQLNVMSMQVGKTSPQIYTGMLDRIARSWQPTRPDPGSIAATEPQEPGQTPPKSNANSRPNEQKTAQHNGPPTGLKGRCPVTLHQSRRWLRGDKQYSVEYKGLVYFFAGAEEKAAFEQDPDRFAPKLLGCDAVVLSQSHRAIPGRIDCGVFFDNQLYLFSSKGNREEFKRQPLKYLRLKHAIRADQIETVRL